MIATRHTAATGIKYRMIAPRIWQHIDTNGGDARPVGPIYKTEKELLADHDDYICRAWLPLEPSQTTGADRVAELETRIAELLADRDACAKDYDRLQNDRDVLFNSEAALREENKRLHKIIETANATIANFADTAEALRLTLEHVAAIAHAGGLLKMDESSTLTTVRRLTAGYYDGVGTHAEALARLSRAVSVALKVGKS